MNKIGNFHLNTIFKKINNKLTMKLKMRTL